MKVYIVYEYAVIEHEERVRNMGVFSSEDKAAEAVLEYEKWPADSSHHHEYQYEEFALDEIWEGRI
jgi:hypothetical protein